MNTLKTTLLLILCTGAVTHGQRIDLTETSGATARWVAADDNFIELYDAIQDFLTSASLPATGNPWAAGMWYHGDVSSAYEVSALPESPDNLAQIRATITVSSGPITITIPTSERIGTVGTTTSLSLANGHHELSMVYVGGAWSLTDSDAGLLPADSVGLDELEHQTANRVYGTNAAGAPTMLTAGEGIAFTDGVVSATAAAVVSWVADWPGTPVDGVVYVKSTDSLARTWDGATTASWAVTIVEPTSTVLDENWGTLIVGSLYGDMSGGGDLTDLGPYTRNSTALAPVGIIWHDGVGVAVRINSDGGNNRYMRSDQVTTALAEPWSSVTVAGSFRPPVGGFNIAGIGTQSEGLHYGLRIRNTNSGSVDIHLQSGSDISGTGSTTAIAVSSPEVTEWWYYELTISGDTISAFVWPIADSKPASPVSRTITGDIPFTQFQLIAYSATVAGLRVGPYTVTID